MSTSKAWKEAERTVAKELLGPAGIRIVRHKGGRGVDFGDIGFELPDGSVIPPKTMRADVKHEKTHPATTAWRAMKKSADRSRSKDNPNYPIPLVVLREHGSPRTLLVVDLDDVPALAKVLPF